VNKQLKLVSHFKELDKQVNELDSQTKTWHQSNELSRKLEKVPGIGPITASALVATMGDAKNFDNGRQVAAWLELVARQHASGGKNVLLGISKRGDSYVCTLPIHGARAVISAAQRNGKQAQGWLGKLLSRCHTNLAVVALANKNARIAWALLANGQEFEANYGVAGSIEAVAHSHPRSYAGVAPSSKRLFQWHIQLKPFWQCQT
jgi:transposase